MKKFAVNLLKPGMVFTEPVYIDNDNILVPAGIPIREKDIGKLLSWGIANVLTDGAARTAEEVSQIKNSYSSSMLGPANSPENASGAANKKNSLLSLTEVQGNKGVYRIYISVIERLNSLFISISSKVPVDARPIDEICSKILHGVREHRESYIGFILGGEVKGYEMAKSSVNTAILSALIAQELKLPHHRIMQTVTGALLHDAGMLRLPRKILDKRGGLSEVERRQMKGHPLLAHRIVREIPYPDEVGIVVLQHHERWDGGGYPRHLAGANIDMGARIVSVADAFEAMVSQKPYRNSMVGYQAMKNLLADNGRHFDPDVLKAFVLTMGIYPIGSIVQLNNTAVARVVETRGNAPLRPKLRVLVDEFGQIFKNETGIAIDLLIEKNLFVTRALDAKEISEKYT